MAKIVGILMLCFAPMVLTACCDCEKESLKTWGPGLMHWGETASSQPMAK